MSDVVIEFTDEEKEAITDEAKRRHIYDTSRGMRGRNRAPASGEEAYWYNLLGCAGEMAVAKYLDLKPHLFQDKGPLRGSCDLPGGIDVKTRSQHWHDLIVQLDDEPDKIFWLVTIENKEVRIRGWIGGHEAMREEFIKDPVGGRAAYFVLRRHLKSPQDWEDR
jgi:hypothetical protein